VLAGRSVRFLVPVRDAGQRIYYANHASHLDFLLVWAALPPVLRRRTRPVAGLDYWSRSRFKRYLAEEIFGAVLIERPKGDAVARRNGAAGLNPVLDALEDGDSLVFFPEGTRGSGEGIAPFKSGLYHLARARPDLELVPVRIGGAARVLAKGQWVPVPRTSRLTFGAPLRMQEGESKDAFLARAREAIVELPES
jgi:1-acyl-sn-glycerol-3-phosphate acyltransferase